MRLLRFVALVGFLCTSSPAMGQRVRGGIMAGPSWPAGAESSLDTGFGGEAWVAVELPGFPVMPRAVFAVDRFSNFDQGGNLNMRTGRLDLVVNPRDIPLDPLGFVGAGVSGTEYQAFASEPPPIGPVDAAATFAGGIGARIGLGPIRGIAEARYLTVTGAEFQVVQLRVGLGF